MWIMRLCSNFSPIGFPGVRKIWKRNETAEEEKNKAKNKKNVSITTLCTCWLAFRRIGAIWLKPATRTCDRVNMGIKRQYFHFDVDLLTVRNRNSICRVDDRRNRTSRSLCSIAFYWCKPYIDCLQLAHEWAASSTATTRLPNEFGA